MVNGATPACLVFGREFVNDVSTGTPTEKIADTGVFAQSRNPIYVGAHIGTIGAAIALNSLWILATLVPFYLVIRYGVVAREEAYLERTFGQGAIAESW